MATETTTPPLTVSADIRDAPAYTFLAASRYLGMPQATLRYWVLGRVGRGAQPASCEPLIHAPAGSTGHISFNNLVEAHVLRALRTGKNIRMSVLRRAITFAENALGIERLLLREELRTSGQAVFLEHLHELIDLSRSGQLAMRRMLKAYLERVERDEDALPFRLYPFRHTLSEHNRSIVIDPRVSFGRPTVAGSGISTAALVDRYDAGEDIEALAADYQLNAAQIEDAVLYEKAA